MSEVDLDEDMLRLAESHDVVIICEDCDEIDFYESFEEDAQKVLYLGTSESFAKWKRTRLQ
jgi:hypothetical protein